MKWTTKDGVVVDITDMTDSHLENCIKLMSRRITEAEDRLFWSRESDSQLGSITSYTTSSIEEVVEGMKVVLDRLEGERYKRLIILN